MVIVRELKDLPAWERLFKKIVWKQLGDIKDKNILDFGSGEGITANYFAEKNCVVAVEPWEDMLKDAWTDNEYRQIIGDVNSLKEFEDNCFDIIICHNVLEYIDDKENVIRELERVLKPNGFISLVKHNRNGRIMQMAVLLDDFDKANALLDGENSTASKFGAIRYYEDSQIEEWSSGLFIEKTFGIRTFWDLQQNQEKHSDEEWQEKMMKLELRVSELEDFIDIAFFHHLIIRKTEKECLF
jgi:SAM-dependent methyltransferase